MTTLAAADRRPAHLLVAGLLTLLLAVAQLLFDH